MHINTLPDDCLRLILRKFTLQQLLHLRIICTQWKVLIEQSFADSQSSLKLFAFKDSVAVYSEMLTNHMATDHVDFGLKDDVLVIAAEKKTLACECIPVLFPNITRLIVTNLSMSGCEQFPLMIRKWPEMISLTLLGFDKSANLQPQIWESINSLRSLRRLHLFAVYKSPFPSQQLTVLSQLEHFSLVQYLGDSITVLGQLGPSCKVMHLSFIFLSAEELSHLIESNDSLSRNLTHLTLGFISTPTNRVNREKNFYQLLRFICGHFEVIKYLNIMFADHLPLLVLIPELSKLTHLTELWLYIGRDELCTSNRSDRNKMYNLPQLKSVKQLNLEIYQISSNEFHEYLTRLFPYIQKLTVKCDFDTPEQVQQFKLDCFRWFPYLLDFKVKL